MYYYQNSFYLVPALLDLRLLHLLDVLGLGDAERTVRLRLRLREVDGAVRLLLDHLRAVLWVNHGVRGGIRERIRGGGGRGRRQQQQEQERKALENTILKKQNILEARNVLPQMAFFFT